MSRKLLSVILAVILGAALLTACGEPAVDDDVDEEPAEPEETRVLTIATPYGIDVLDPMRYTADGDMYVLSQIYEPLVNYDADGTIAYRLAESHENPDSETWIFHLRDNIYWHDGNEVFAEGTQERVTADDVVFTLEFILDPDNDARLYSELVGVIDTVEAVDTDTVKITTQGPYAFLLEEMNRIPIISRKVVEQLGSEDYADAYVGSGPFRFVEYRPDDMVVLEKNENFFIEPQVDEVRFDIIPERSVALIALETGEVDIALQLPTEELDRILAEDEIEVIPNNRGWYRYAAFNVDVEPFDDFRVREAIAYGTDMESIVRTIFPEEQLAEVAYGPVPRGILGFSEDWHEMWEYDPDRAVQILEDAGWTRGTDGIFEKDGERLAFDLVGPDDPPRERLAVMLSTRWQDIGVEANVITQEWASHMDTIIRGDTEMFIMGGGSTADGLVYMFAEAEGGAHNTNYYNPELNEMIYEAIRIVDEQEREELWREAAEVVIRDRVHIPAYYEYIQIGTRKNVVDFWPPTPWFSLVSEYRHVRFSD